MYIVHCTMYMHNFCMHMHIYCMYRWCNILVYHVRWLNKREIKLNIKYILVDPGRPEHEYLSIPTSQPASQLNISFFFLKSNPFRLQLVIRIRNIPATTGTIYFSKRNAFPMITASPRAPKAQNSSV